MDTIFNILVMFAVLVASLGAGLVAIRLFDRFVFPDLDFENELRNGNRAVGFVVGALLLGIMLVASRAGAAPLDRYDDSFRKWSRVHFGYEVDWRNFKAQGMTESNLKPDVCSQVGACGVMQFMPGTALGMGLQNRFDAKASIRFGIKYDKRLWRQFTAPRPAFDRLAFAFMSYNAGLGNILKFQQRALADGADPNLFATIRPYVWREPGEYVERIERWRVRFARRL